MRQRSERGATPYTATVSDVVRDDSGRVAGVELRRRSGSMVLRGRSVIGADGRGSRLAGRFGAAHRDVFAITRELATFPEVSRFVALQRRLSQAIERDAIELAARPEVGSESVLAA